MTWVLQQPLVNKEFWLALREAALKMQLSSADHYEANARNPG